MMPPKRLTDKQKFFLAADWAASEIFFYRRNEPEIFDSAHVFDYGEVSDDQSTASVVFSCTETSGRGTSILRIAAHKIGKAISISHKISSAA